MTSYLIFTRVTDRPYLYGGRPFYRPHAIVHSKEMADYEVSNSKNNMVVELPYDEALQFYDAKFYKFAD